MPDVMMKLGDVKFGMGGPAYNKLSHTLNADWASQPRIGRRPALQFTGVGSETVVLSGVIYPVLLKIGGSAIKAIEGMITKAAPQMLIDGTGRNYGYFVVKSLQQDKEAFITNGASQKQGFTITLERYGEDMLKSDAIMGGGNTDVGGARAAATA